MTEERLIEIEQLARQYGSPNCWTGTTGTLAAVIIELLVEIKLLRDGRTEVEQTAEWFTEREKDAVIEKWVNISVERILDKLKGKQ